MNTKIETVRLIKIQARTLLRFLERKGLGLSQGDPVKEIWADVETFAKGNRGLSHLTELWQRHSMSACDATCVGLYHKCTNAGVFLALYHFCREDEGYRLAGTIPWIALALAFKAGLPGATAGDERLLFDELEEDLELAYQGSETVARDSKATSSSQPGRATRLPGTGQP